MHLNADHYRKLERMYLSAPVNKSTYSDISILVSHEKAEISLPVKPEYFHAARSLHGSVYFKLLDDAAFFAASSVVEKIFVYTVSFHIQLLRPVTHGIIRAKGEIKFKSENLIVADSVLTNENNKVVARGSGNFMKSKILLSEDIGYH